MPRIMARWTKQVANLTKDDREAFDNFSRVAGHFGLPFTLPSRIFSRFLDDDGSVRAATKELRREGAFGHFAAYKLFAVNEPEVWIWNERYWFSSAPAPVACMVRPQELFRERFGAERIQRIEELANKKGLFQTCPTGPGLPDLAVFAPKNVIPWRFVEVKRPEKRDKLNKRQEDWLELLANVLGPECVIELELREAR